jgi:hypothetical protein
MKVLVGPDDGHRDADPLRVPSALAGQLLILGLPIAANQTNDASFTFAGRSLYRYRPWVSTAPQSGH